MMQTPEQLAETPDFVADALSHVVDLIHVRGETARVIAPEGAYAMDVAAGYPCVYVVEQGALRLRDSDSEPVSLH